jgi:hypothetical protein
MIRGGAEFGGVGPSAPNPASAPGFYVEELIGFRACIARKATQGILRRQPDVGREDAGDAAEGTPLYDFAQTSALTAALPSPAKEMVLLSIVTSLNVAELLGLTWK